MSVTTQYLIRTNDGMDYMRVEPWQGGAVAAIDEARRIKGYVVELDADLCVICPTIIIADFRNDKTRPIEAYGIQRVSETYSVSLDCNQIGEVEVYEYSNMVTFTLYTRGDPNAPDTITQHDTYAAFQQYLTEMEY
jgi:hypothetical protein